MIYILYGLSVVSAVGKKPLPSQPASATQAPSPSQSSIQPVQGGCAEETESLTPTPGLAPNGETENALAGTEEKLQANIRKSALISFSIAAFLSYPW